MPEPFTIDFDATAIVQELTSLQVRQWPFARAMAATNLAYDARDALRDELPQKFHLTSTWLQRGILVDRATKPRPVATVFSRDEYLGVHVTSGIRRAKKKYRAVPTTNVKRTGKGKISKANRPAALLQKRNVFIDDSAEGGPVIMRRVGKRLQALYSLKRQTRYRKRWDFSGTVTATVRTNQVRRVNEALERAVKTSRRR